MNPELTKHIIAVFDAKIATKRESVGLSFYAFFQNKNTDPATLMQVATWWIEAHQLDHFEKASKIRAMVSEDEKNGF